ncbi:polysaccharide deacetylase family sporulation protein PdaB [Salinibacillus xinjiangensis]|uniref:Polysaccharide deacetylase family sporulation protein PdaB n=1 Tax=Salinibacillus xinjiangensis TaxID=1229268 RepID=A0A6G1XBA4_9BACI|nr:polysaccharide deacetylase family sporulation protein PdaB [Salinibacillus xinjiangensis]MRG88068.1 polysaccharide deacetylase family sporulation protein PdaB [Salinibacillus xinjiangensis]
MKHFQVVKLNNRKQWLIILFMAFFAAFYLFAETTSSFSVFNKNETETQALIKSGEKNSKQIALTFNISWGQEKVYKVLDVLKKENIHATFFVSGEWAERHPEILNKIAEDNHEIGMLGYRYKSYVKQDIEEVRKDLLQAKEVFRKLGYEDLTLVRPPSGHFNEEVLDTVKKLGFSTIYWSINPNDWKNPGSKEIVNTVLDDASSGDIILLHASDIIKHTETALKDIIPAIKKKKLSFVTVSELISNSSSESKPLN